MNLKFIRKRIDKEVKFFLNSDNFLFYNKKRNLKCQ